MAARADLPALTPLYAEAHREHAEIAPTFFRAVDRDDRAELDRLFEDDSRILVAVEGGEVCGVCRVTLYDTPRQPGLVPRRRAYLQEIIVTSRRRRSGIGRELLRAAESWAKSKGAEQLNLTVWAGNHCAEAFYARLGYRVINQVLGTEL